MAKHSWTNQELWTVCVCYKEELPIDVALRLTKTTNEKSMEMRYANCLYLDKGKVEGALSHASKAHQQMWEEVQDWYSHHQLKPLRKQEEDRVTRVVETALILGVSLCILVSGFALYFA